MTNSNLIENDFKILLISLTLTTRASIDYKTEGFHAVDAPGDIISVAVLFQKEP